MSAAEQQHNLYKKQAAEYAVALIRSGMVVGLGMGSTALYAVQHMAKLYDQGELRDIVGVPCGSAVEAEARRLGLPIANIDDHPQIDLTIDGADEVDPQLNLIKGGGAALLREKIVAQSTRREVIIVDQSKLSEKLGTVWALPVEVIPFGWATQARWIASLGAEVKLRTQSDGSPLKTDQGNLLLDCRFGPIADPYTLADQLAKRAGIVEHGLFLGLTSDLIIAGADGIRHVNGPHAS